MTITLSPEVEGQIRELLRLWGWDANDPLLAEATARAAMVNGLRSVLEATRDAKAAIAPMQAGVIGERGLIPQSVPDASVFEESLRQGHSRAMGRRRRCQVSEPSMPPHTEGETYRSTNGEDYVYRNGKWEHVPHLPNLSHQMRDYFAGQALAGLMNGIDLSSMGRTEDVYRKNVSAFMQTKSVTAYLAADAMLAARAVKPEGNP